MKKFLLLVLNLILFYQLFSQTNNHLISKANQYLSQNLIDSAYYTLVKIIAQNPNNIQALLLMGDIFAIKGDTTEAARFYKKVITLDSTNIQAYINLGKLAFANQKYTQATHYFFKAYKINPNSDITNAWLGFLYLSKKQHDSAQFFFNKALTLSSNKAQIYTFIARSYNQLEHLDSALNYYNKAISIDSTNPNLYQERSKLFIILKNYDKALQDINKAIKLNPNNIDYYRDKISIYIYKKDIEQAIEFGKKWAKKLADSAFYSLLIYAMLHNQTPIDTVRYYINIGIQQTESSELYYALGITYEIELNFKKANHYFKKAIERNPWDIRYHKEEIATQLWMNTPNLDSNFSFSGFEYTQLKNLRKLTKQQKSRYYKPILLAKFKQDPLSMGLDEYLMLYIGSSLDKTYNPFLKETNFLEIQNLSEQKPYPEVLKKAQNILKYDPTNIGIYYLMTLLSFYQQDLQNFRKFYVPYLGFALAITSSASGASPETAFISIAPIDEFVILKFIGYEQFVMQTQEKFEKHYFNRYKVLKDGEIQEYYFNIDLYYKKLNK